MSKKSQSPRIKVLLFLIVVTGASIAYRTYQGQLVVKKEQSNPTEQPPTDELFAQANELYKNKKYQGAVTVYHELLKQDPSHKQAHISAGLASARMGNIDHAQHHAQQAVKIDNQYLSAYMLLGQCYQSKGQIEQAQATYQQALTIDPDFFEGHLFLSQLLSESETEKAIAHAQRAIELKPNDQMAQSALKDATALTKKIPEQSEEAVA